MNSIHNPPHPGELVKKILIDETRLTITEAARCLGVKRLTLSKIINGHSGISPEMAVRLSSVLGTSSEMWLNMQTAYDLYHAEKQRNKLKTYPLSEEFLQHNSPSYAVAEKQTEYNKNVMKPRRLMLPIGYDIFSELCTKDLDFVDKSLLVKQILDNKDVKVTVITRPRRFGKTLNLTMLYYFFASNANIKPEVTKNFFTNLKIAQVADGAYMQHQGKYPVVFISLKDVKFRSYEMTLESLKKTISDLYSEHRYLLQSPALNEDEKKLYQAIIERTTDETEIINALRDLCRYLHAHFQQKVWLLIDEYDTPIHAGYLNNYYEQLMDLMRAMYAAAFKTNPYLEHAVITGILRIAKESLFSGMNNVTISTLLQPEYSEFFGFTEAEVGDLLKQAGFTDKEKDIKKWYNGYTFGGTTVYNPWSIVNCFREKGLLKLYWVNTSDNQLIRTLITKSGLEFKEQFLQLMQGKTIAKNIEESTVFADLINNSQAAWGLLVMAGYLKVVSFTYNAMGEMICECAIPNFEVKALYCNIIENWLSDGSGTLWYQNFLTYLLSGNIAKFEENFGRVLAQTISVYDVAHNPEAFYHGFMLGLAAGLDQKQYEVKSNRESGDGRYDIAIIPKSLLKPAIILEIKSVEPPKVAKSKVANLLDKQLKLEAQKALKQINRNHYVNELMQRGFANFVKIGLAFSGKEFKLKSEIK